MFFALSTVPSFCQREGRTLSRSGCSPVNSWPPGCLFAGHADQDSQLERAVARVCRIVLDNPFRMPVRNQHVCVGKSKDQLQVHL
jgi:hypothetical protein